MQKKSLLAWWLAVGCRQVRLLDSQKGYSQGDLQRKHESMERRLPHTNSAYHANKSLLRLRVEVLGVWGLGFRVSESSGMAGTRVSISFACYLFASVACGHPARFKPVSGTAYDRDGVEAARMVRMLRFWHLLLFHVLRILVRNSPA